MKTLPAIIVFFLQMKKILKCDTIEYENKTYAFMLSVDELDSEDVYIMQENVQKNSCEYCPVEDDKTLNILFGIFKERNRDWLIFDD